MHRHRVNLGVSVVARKLGDPDEDLLAWQLKAADLLTTTYPPDHGATRA